MIDKEKLERVYKEFLEEKIINYLAEVKKFSIRQAMDIYYRSRLSLQIHDGMNRNYSVRNL